MAAVLQPPIQDTEMADGSINGDTMDVDGGVSLNETNGKLPITVTKPIPYTFDLGDLTLFDANPLGRNPSQSHLDATARDCAQALINQLLTTCPIISNSVTSKDSGVALTLPAPNSQLPREKPLPTPKPPTKWELFAAKKGIKDKKRDGKMVYDEATGEWVPKWGYKGKNKEGDSEWLVEVDEKKEREKGEPVANPRNDNRKERVERIKRNERKMRANERRTAKGGTAK